MPKKKISHQSSGELIPGEFEVSLSVIEKEFGNQNTTRKKLMRGLKSACQNFVAAGVKKIWVNGSFITTKEHPGDIDGCWEYTEEVNLNMLDSVFLLKSRKPMKEKYGLEFFPACIIEGASRKPFPEFFQTNREGEAKGILTVILGERT